MCIGFVVSNFPPHSPIKKLILFNRDEAVARPSLPLSKHQDGLFYGFDIPSQGTWLAFSPTKFAFITNLDDVPFKPISDLQFKRGKIVKAALSLDSPLLTEIQLQEVLSQFVAHRSSYNGFNLVVGNLRSDSFGYFCNTDEAPFIFTNSDLEKHEGVQVFAVSNGHALNDKYPKMESESLTIKDIVDQWLSASSLDELELLERLEKVMRKFTIPGTNSEPDDSAFNDIFIRPYFEEDRKQIFGTVSSTFVIVRHNSVRAKEITWDFKKNEEIQEILKEIDNVNQELSSDSAQESKFEKLKILSNKAMNEFKFAHSGIEVQITLK